MYKFSYAEILDDDCQEARQRERMALDQALELMTRAEVCGPKSPEALEAIKFAQKLWSVLIESLADPENALAEALRADLISIGLWVLRETDAILRDGSGSFAALIKINRSIRDGLN